MPRSSSGVFHAVSSPCVPVNTPPSGGPTSSPKMSVTPSLCSPTCSAMRMAWIIVAISVLPAHVVLVGKHVVVDRLRRRLRLVTHLLGRLAELRSVARTQLIDLRSGQQRPRFELLLERLEAIELALDQIRAA